MVTVWQVKGQRLRNTRSSCCGARMKRVYRADFSGRAGREVRP